MRQLVRTTAMGVLLLAACGPAPADTAAAEAARLEHGGRLADAAFTALSTHLQQAMQAGGPAHAVDFCSLNALSIVDSLSTSQGARIRRASNRARAPHGRPDSLEARQLEDMLAQWEAGANVTGIAPRVVLQGDSVASFQPIFIQSPTCLKCHGTPGEALDPAAYAGIRERYPEDQAVNYALGDLRGLWSIRWRE